MRKEKPVSPYRATFGAWKRLALGAMFAIALFLIVWAFVHGR